MVAKGTYADLQRSGVDFTSLLKEDDEQQQQQPQDVPTRIRTLSQNSTLSQTSSVHSVKDGDHLPVRTPSFLNVTGDSVSRPRRFLVLFLPLVVGAGSGAAAVSVQRGLKLSHVG